jgi:hypothetical protein
VIARQGLDGAGGRFEQRPVAHALVAGQKGPQGLGDSEGEHEVMAGQLTFELALQPQVRLAVLALRTMAVAAGGGDYMGMAAVLALVANRPEGLSRRRTWTKK